MLETEHLSSSCLCSGIAPVLAYAFAYKNAYSIYSGSTKINACTTTVYTETPPNNVTTSGQMAHDEPYGNGSRAITTILYGLFLSTNFIFNAWYESHLWSKHEIMFCVAQKQFRRPFLPVVDSGARPKVRQTVIFKYLCKLMQNGLWPSPSQRRYFYVSTIHYNLQ